MMPPTIEEPLRRSWSSAQRESCCGGRWSTDRWAPANGGSLRVRETTFGLDCALSPVDGLRAHGVRQGCRGDGVGVEVELGVVVVGERVARLVVARVVRLACRAPVDRGLSRRLDALGAGEEAAGGDVDPGRDERSVVGPAVE